MRRRHRWLVILQVLLSMGCAHDMISERDRLLMSGRYGDLQKHAEAEISQSGSAKTPVLFPLCIAYANAKRYDRLFECCDRLESNIRSGDTSSVDYEEMARKNPLIGGIAKAQASPQAKNVSDVSAFPFILRTSAYIDHGRYDKAIEEGRKAYDMGVRGIGHDTTRLFATGVLGLAYALNGNREAALDMADGLDKLAVSQVLSAQKNVALAKIYLALNEFRKAFDVVSRDDGAAFRSGIDMITGASLKGESLFTWQELPKSFMANKCLMETGKIKEAKTGYDALLNMPQTRDNGAIHWMILYDRGRIAEQEKDLKEAVRFYRQAVTIIEQQRSTINTETSKIGFVGDKQSVYCRLVFTLCADGEYGAAFEYAERAKSRALVDMLAAKQDFTAKTGDKRAIRELLAAQAAQEKELLVQDESVNRSQTRGIAIKNRATLTEQSPELASLVSVTSLSVHEIQSSIPDDEVLIEYYYAGNEMVAFILSSRGLKAVQLNGNGLIGEIQEFRRRVGNRESSDYGELSRRLYARLVAPLEDSLHNRNLIIVPHGALHYLPFNALYDGKGYLIDQYGIRILPSASVIKYLPVKKGVGLADILAFGNPDLGDPRFDLPYAQNEAIAVADTRPTSKVLLGKEATEAAFERFGGEFDIIHFAAHGQFDGEAPLRSAIMLAREGQTDGMLTVDKLYALKLNADLVTLSACETGLGKIASGDDIVGLTRGFLYAGSSSVVASLWKVDDLATAHLMTQFYANLKTSNKREALRSAQLDTKGKHPHPFYWASFQLTGKAR
jgi:CHAT domain-containing protein